MPKKPRLKTIEDALEWIQTIGICALFGAKGLKLPTLYEAVALPDNAGRTKWGARLEAVWAWKNQLPSLYPDEVFYGKIPGGHAALISMDYLRTQHYPETHRSLARCSPLAQKVFDIARLGSATTAELREAAQSQCACTKSRFETALKELQITLNLARLNEPDLAHDTWLPFLELYPEFDT